MLEFANYIRTLDVTILKKYYVQVIICKSQKQEKEARKIIRDMLRESSISIENIKLEGIIALMSLEGAKRNFMCN